MTKIKYIPSALIILGILAISGCKDDPTPLSELEQRLIDLMNGGSQWIVGNGGVVKDGFDVTDQFTEFKLTIGNKTYSSINGLSPVWEASGTWDFQNNDPALILRDGLTPITVSLSSNTLTLTFTADGISGGKIKSVTGQYQFHLVSE